MTMNHQYQSGYLANLFHLPSFELTVSQSIDHVSFLQKKYGFDSIAFTGSSGAGLAYTLSYSLHIPLIMVRKETDKNHSMLKLEGNIEAEKYLIVDDMISSGETVARIVSTIYKELPLAACVGVYLYSGYFEEDFDLGWGPKFPLLPVHTLHCMNADKTGSYRPEKHLRPRKYNGGYGIVPNPTL